MSEEFRIWRLKEPMTLCISGEQREVRYAVPADIRMVTSHLSSRPWLVSSAEDELTGPEITEVPIKCIRNVLEDDDWPQTQWAIGPMMPAGKFLELYEPEENDE